jgi:hypothetical protein
MSGFFGVISKTGCVEDVFYRVDYHSHLGTKRTGMAFIVPGEGFLNLDELVSVIRLLKEKLRTPCRDGSNYY